MSTVKALSELGRPVAYYPTIARAFGGNVATAIFLCQFIYWRGKVGNREVYKTRDEIEEETGVSHDAQRRIVTQLKKEGMLTVVKKGMPAKNYYRFEWEAIDKRIETFTASTRWGIPSTSGGESRALVVGNPEHKTWGIPSTTSETTTETTTESTEHVSTPKKAKIKHPVFDVPVGEARFERMVTEYGRGQVDDWIERVINYVDSKGKKPYRDYAATAENWMKDAGVEKMKVREHHTHRPLSEEEKAAGEQEFRRLKEMLS